MKNITLLIATGITITCLSCNQVQHEVAKSYTRAYGIQSPDSALQLLTDGNKRFVSETVLTDDLSSTKRKKLMDEGQKPFAVIVTCSDSRLAPELLFDQGLGDLFVIRVAGNVIDSVAMGSIQYAVEHLGIPLVMVLGHEKCGAVKATIGGGEFPGSIPSIASRIQPSVNKVKTLNAENNNIENLVIEANVDANIEILNNDVLLKHIIEKGAVKTLGAVYHLATGVVEFNATEQTITREKHLE